MLDQFLFWIGSILLFAGGVFDLLASIGLLRFPNFYVRLHAATIGAVYGAFLPLLGISLLVLSLDDFPAKYMVAGGAFVTGIIILIVAPVGSHVLAYAAHKSKTVQWKPTVDHLEEDSH
ncbi:MAG: monovalent cation/H(+) antiporter subunit G [Thermosphaera sp.]